MSTTAITTQTVQLAIRATPEQVWNALTDGAVTPAYYIGFTAEFHLTPGAPYRYTAGGAEVITGEVLAVEPGRTLLRRSTAPGRPRWPSCPSPG